MIKMAFCAFVMAVTFERLMSENNLGDLAFLRNLRNMTKAEVPLNTIIRYGNSRKWGRVLPFRFIAAAQVVPQLEPHLERWMFTCLNDAPKLKGTTILLCDVSSSMGAKLSNKSDLTRDDAMKGLAMLLREVCENVIFVPFAQQPITGIPPRRGFALNDVLDRNNTHDGTNIGLAVKYANSQFADRIICITDEQSHDNVGKPTAKYGYMINVANNKNGVGYGSWTKIDGFSEAVVDYILESETID
ncbi:MAG: VWA domain-containing protein [Bacteroidia bacterium]|nr:VWA domain-containing protein [Bacteroidia bacterium]